MKKTATTMLAFTVALSAGCGALPRKEVVKILAGVKGRLAVSVVDETQKDGAKNGSWNVRGDEPFAAGESIGVFVVAELFRQADAGEADLDESVQLACNKRPLRLRTLGSVSEVSLRDLAVLVLADVVRLAGYAFGLTCRYRIVVEGFGKGSQDPLPEATCLLQRHGTSTTITPLQGRAGSPAPAGSFDS